MSEPGRCCTARSAWVASWMRRGSATRSRAPLALARMIRRATRGWHSVVLEPMTRMQAACSRSSRELVMAPLPRVAARPATVELWQSRAQWSTLLVPSTVRANFWAR
jgi:hypothetical protein